MLVARLCSYFDEVLVLEFIHARNDVTPMFRNMLDYIYRTHLLMCTVIYEYLTESVRKQNKWAAFLGEILDMNWGPSVSLRTKIRGEAIQLI